MHRITLIVVLVLATTADARGRRRGCSSGGCYSQPAMGCSWGCSYHFSVGCSSGRCYQPAMGCASCSTASTNGHKKMTSATSDDRAKVIVQLPENATLKINGQKMTSTGARRTFVSPALEKGQEYYYDFETTIMRDGQKVVEKKRVNVAAGSTTSLEIDFPPARVANR